MNQALFSFIKHVPTAYHAAAHTAELLQNAGYTLLNEAEEWKLENGKGYYVLRNGSSLIAFRMKSEFSGFMMTAAHGDSPAFKIKENAEMEDANYLRLSTEKYGGMLCSSWMDRPLSIAGRVTVRSNEGFAVRLVDLEGVSAIIPNVAIHMNRNANENASYNASVDMLPLYGMKSDAGTLKKRIAEHLGVNETDILTTDLFLYNPQEGVCFNRLIAAPRLDDLQCAFAAMTAFLQAKDGKGLPIYCLFDNEEVGSQTKQGAASTFLRDVLFRISHAANLDGEAMQCKFADSFLVSCDNAHAVHPNHAEYKDPNHTAVLNGGIVLKYNANQRYTSDAVSAGLFRLICEKAQVPLQYYANRADMPGGSTLGNIADTQVSVNTVDIGLPQLAMHSAMETAGAEDTEYMVRVLERFYQTSISLQKDGSYFIAD